MKYATFRYDTVEVENGLNIRIIIIIKILVNWSTTNGLYMINVCLQTMSQRSQNNVER